MYHLIRYEVQLAPKGVVRVARGGGRRAARGWRVVGIAVIGVGADSQRNSGHSWGAAGSGMCGFTHAALAVVPDRAM